MGWGGGGEGGRKNIWFSGRTERISVVANKVKEEGGGREI